MRRLSRIGDLRVFAAFLVTGGIAALVNILSRIAINQIVPFAIAVVFAYLLGMVTAYVLAKFLVFERSQRSVAHEFTRFALVNLVALIQIWTVSVALAWWFFPWVGFTWHPETVAHVIAVLSPVATSFLLHKNFTFASEADPLPTQVDIDRLDA